MERLYSSTRESESSAPAHPSERVLRSASDNILVARLDALRDGSALSVADGDAVERANGHDFSGSACEEELVRHVERLARDRLDVYPQAGLGAVTC